MIDVSLVWWELTAHCLFDRVFQHGSFLLVMVLNSGPVFLINYHYRLLIYLPNQLYRLDDL